MGRIQLSRDSSTRFGQLPVSYSLRSARVKSMDLTGNIVEEGFFGAVSITNEPALRGDLTQLNKIVLDDGDKIED